MIPLASPDDFWAVVARRCPPRASREVAPLLYALAKFCRARRTLEVGIAEGWTAFAFGLHAKEAGGLHTAVDVHPQPVERLRRLAPEHGLPVEALHADSATLAWDRPVDILYIDGGHAYEQVRGDIANLARWARLVVFHDYWKNPEVRRAVDEACTPLCLPHGTGLALWQR